MIYLLKYVLAEMKMDGENNHRMNNRVIEWPGLKRTTMFIQFQPPYYVQDRQPADQAAQSHIQPGLDLKSLFWGSFSPC